MNNRKGQSALEFLMTYGWAILVVLAAIGALAYFGVLNPTNFLPDQCIGSTGFGCVGHPSLQPTQIQWIMVNGIGNSLNLDRSTATVVSSIPGCTNLNLTFCTKGSNPCNLSTLLVQNGQEVQFMLACTTTSTATKNTIYLNYTDPNTQFTQGLVIQISGKTKTS